MGRFKKPPKAPKTRPKPLPPPKLKKPVRVQRKKPGKAPTKPPKKPVQVPKKPPKKPAKPRKPRKPKEPPKPPKVWISQLFGKTRKERIRPITPQDRERIKEVEEVIAEAQRQARRLRLPFGPTEPSPLGYEYYQLIAGVEKMSAHDVYTLFMSPR